jgi:hypothetical protein
LLSQSTVEVFGNNEPSPVVAFFAVILKSRKAIAKGKAVKHVQTTLFIETACAAGWQRPGSSCPTGIVLFVKMKQTVRDGP